MLNHGGGGGIVLLINPSGAASFVFGAAAFFILPDFPDSKTGSAMWLLTEEERQVAVDRIARDQVSNQDSNRSVWYGLKLSVVDWRVWMFVCDRWTPMVRRSGLTVALGLHSLRQPYRLRFQ